MVTVLIKHIISHNLDEIKLLDSLPGSLKRPALNGDTEPFFTEGLIK